VANLRLLARIPAFAGMTAVRNTHVAQMIPLAALTLVTGLRTRSALLSTREVKACPVGMGNGPGRRWAK